MRYISLSSLKAIYFTALRSWIFHCSEQHSISITISVGKKSEILLNMEEVSIEISVLISIIQARKGLQTQPNGPSSDIYELAQYLILC